MTETAFVNTGFRRRAPPDRRIRRHVPLLSESQPRAVAMILYVLLSMIRIMAKYGQRAVLTVTVLVLLVILTPSV
jgi:hypothetical protein